MAGLDPGSVLRKINLGKTDIKNVAIDSMKEDQLLEKFYACIQ